VRPVGALLGNSFIASSTVALVAAPTAGAAGVLAGISAMLAGSWLAALLVAAGKGERVIPAAVLMVCAAGLGPVISLAGGLGSPLALLLAALVFEPLWVDRGRAGRIAAGAALAIAGSGLALSMMVVPMSSGTVAAWQWLPPLAYLGFVATRLLHGGALNGHGKDDQADLLEASGAIVFQLSKTGDVMSAKGRTKQLLGVPSEILWARDCSNASVSAIGSIFYVRLATR
jgi:hypothetical protein